MKTILFLALNFFAIATSMAGNTTKSKCIALGKVSETSASQPLQTNIFKKNNGKVSVVLIQPNPTAVTISVMDGNSNILLKKSVQETAARQDLDFQKLESGTYTVMVSGGGQCFTKDIQVE